MEKVKKLTKFEDRLVVVMGVVFFGGIGWDSGTLALWHY